MMDGYLFNVTNELWQKLVVDYVLVLRRVDPPGLLEDDVAAPLRPHLGQGVGDQVVLAEEQRLDRSQQHVLIRPKIAL